LSPDTSHLFICFSSKDGESALAIVDSLEAAGLKCWISSRDVPPGHNYQETIVEALEAARGLVFLFSEGSAGSGEIRKELSIAASTNIPVYPLRLSPVTPTGALRYELATRQWIDVFPDREKGLRRLVETIRKGGRVATEARADHAADSAPAAPVRPSEPARAPIVASGSAEFEAVRGLLARHVGPIAKVLIEKAAAQAQTTDDLCERLAAHVRTPADRASFLKAARTGLAKKA
jgi:hypothetical protein